MTPIADAARAPYAVSLGERNAIAAMIDSDELLALALELGNIPSRSREELQAAQFVHDWMKREGFSPRMVGATPSRPNVIGEYGGREGGANLLFTAHLDTESPTGDPVHDRFRYRPETLANPEWMQCWVEEGKIHGFPVANDRGPLACSLIAAKALKRAGIELGGKLYLTASPGEIGPEPIEEFEGVAYLGKDIGAHYVFHHGGVAPDYAIAAEGTDFGMTWQGSGYVVFRIQLLGQGVFTPILDTPHRAVDHPNPIYRLGPVIEALHAWTQRFEAGSSYAGTSSTSNPKAQIASIRGGAPMDFGAGTDICALYLEVGLGPRQTVAPIYHQLHAMLRDLNLGDYDITPVVVRHGAEASDHAIAPLAGAVEHATQLTRGAYCPPAHPVFASMWRDHNVFNRQHIPALTTGMPRWRPTPDDLVASALIYALTMLGVCGRAVGNVSKGPLGPYSNDTPFA